MGGSIKWVGASLCKVDCILLCFYRKKLDKSFKMVFCNFVLNIRNHILGWNSLFEAQKKIYNLLFPHFTQYDVKVLYFRFLLIYGLTV